MFCRWSCTRTWLKRDCSHSPHESSHFRHQGLVSKDDARAPAPLVTFRFLVFRCFLFYSRSWLTRTTCSTLIHSSPFIPSGTAAVVSCPGMLLLSSKWKGFGLPTSGSTWECLATKARQSIETAVCFAASEISVVLFRLIIYSWEMHPPTN